MLFSVAVEAQSLSDGFCQHWAKSVQSESKLPDRPPDNHFEQPISGTQALEMFPRDKSRLRARSSYTFIAKLNNCKPSPGLFVSKIMSGPYEKKSDEYHAFILNRQIGFDRDISELYWRLSYLSTGTAVSRGKGQVAMDGVKIEKGEFAQECIVAPGWKCTAVFKVKDRSSCKTVIRKKFREPTFFPAARNQQPLLNNTWLIQSRELD